MRDARFSEWIMLQSDGTNWHVVPGDEMKVGDFLEKNAAWDGLVYFVAGPKADSDTYMLKCYTLDGKYQHSVWYDYQFMVNDFVLFNKSYGWMGELLEDTLKQAEKNLELPKGHKPSEGDTVYCLHNYVTYTGLRETYQYCTKCDKKLEKKETE